MRAQFVLSEIGIGLRRNLTMTVAVVVTVAISLALFGAGLLIRSQVEESKGYWYDRVEVSVFLCGPNTTEQAVNCSGHEVTATERAVLLSELRATPQVKRVYYESKEQAYARFQETFKSSPDLVANVTADALPESYRVKLKDPTQFEAVASSFRSRPGVEEVQDQKEQLKPFFKVLNGFQTAAITVAIVQLLAAALLISNTVRVAAFSRRRETGIMRLVGASNLYIQLPFLLEGALAGLLGASIAVGLVATVKGVFIDRVLRPAFPLNSFVGWDVVLRQVPVLLLLGVLLSALASFVTLRRHLRV